MTLSSTAVERAIAQCTSRWAMARGHRLNTSIVLAAVHGLSGLFRAVSAVEPITLALFPTLSPSLIGHPASVDVKQHKSQKKGRLVLQLSLSSPSEPLLGPAAPPLPCCAGVEPPGPALLAPPHHHPRASSAEPQPGGRTKEEGRMSRRRDGGCSPSIKRSQSIAGLTASACAAFSLVVSISRRCAYPTTLSSIPCRRPWNEVSRADRPRWSPKVAARTAKTWAAVSASPAARVSTSLRADPSNAWISHSTAVPSSILKFRRMSSAS